MNLVSKKIFQVTSLCGVVAVLAGCTGMCPQHKNKPHRPMHQSEEVMHHQVRDKMEGACATAHMFTRSSCGGESKMGYIKFKEVDNGVKMKVDVKDLRQGVNYVVKLQQCTPCVNNANECCEMESVSVDLPTLQAQKHGHLKQTYMVQGVTPEQLQNAKIYLERDGGYKAAWGTFKTAR